MRGEAHDGLGELLFLRVGLVWADGAECGLQLRDLLLIYLDGLLSGLLRTGTTLGIECARGAGLSGGGRSWGSGRSCAGLFFAGLWSLLCACGVSTRLGSGGGTAA